MSKYKIAHENYSPSYVYIVDDHGNYIASFRRDAPMDAKAEAEVLLAKLRAKEPKPKYRMESNGLGWGVYSQGLSAVWYQNHFPDAQARAQAACDELNARES